MVQLEEDFAKVPTTTAVNLLTDVQLEKSNRKHKEVCGLGLLPSRKE
jgi:hypothetical protein